jgi:hypothetical protein
MPNAPQNNQPTQAQQNMEQLRRGLLEDFVPDRHLIGCDRCGGVIEENAQRVEGMFGFRILCAPCFIELTRNQEVFEPHDKKKPKPKFEQGTIIKSDRQFGLEFEVNLDLAGQHTLRDLVARDFNLVHDGSVNAGIEVVSPILCGKTGEDKIKAMCSSLQKVKAGADDSCGLHVHIDAADYFENTRIDLTTLSVIGKIRDCRIYVLDATLQKTMREDNYGLWEAVYSNGSLDQFTVNEFLDYMQSGKSVANLPVVWADDGKVAETFIQFYTPIGSRGARIKNNDSIKTEADIKKYHGEPSLVTFGYSKFVVIDRETSNNLYCVCVPKSYSKGDKDRLDRIKRVASFYIAFDDVLAAMLPCDRRDNDFAIRASTRMSIRDVSVCASILDFFNAWTKTKDLRGFRLSMGEQRHESRYYGINFRALLKHGTIEIRYHAGTTDADKALHWTALHQRIVDIAADLKDPRFNLDRLEKADMVIEIDRKADLFFAKLNLPSDTETYLRKRISEYSGEDSHFVESLIADDK